MFSSLSLYGFLKNALFIPYGHQIYIVIDIILYLDTLPIDHLFYSSSSLCFSYNLSQAQNYNSSCTFYKTNMLLLYYIMLSILEPFITFFVSYNHVICNCDICDHTVIGVMILSHFITYVTITYDIILYPLPKSKIK